MISTPLKGGFYSTSTPIHTFSDSGYHGSERSQTSSVPHSLSPIREISPFKRRLVGVKSFESPLVNVCTSSHNFAKPHLEEINVYHNEAKKVLDFSNFSSFSQECCVTSDSVVKLHSSSLSTTINSTIDTEVSVNSSSNCSYSGENSTNGEVKLVSNVQLHGKYRCKKVDFLQRLFKMNCTRILHDILKHLAPEDLCKVCCVSKTWKQLVLKDYIANKRRRRFIRDKIRRKENLLEGSLDEGIKLEETGEDEQRPILKISNINLPKQPLDYHTKFNSFVQEGMNLKSGILKPCPRCKFAARCHDGICYFCPECNYAFCEKCLNPYSVNHLCIKQTNTSMKPNIIGSKKCKKNLKRL